MTENWCKQVTVDGEGKGGQVVWVFDVRVRRGVGRDREIDKSICLTGAEVRNALLMKYCMRI